VSNQISILMYHSSGKSLYLADTLLQAPLPQRRKMSGLRKSYRGCRQSLNHYQFMEISSMYSGKNKQKTKCVVHWLSSVGLVGLSNENVQ